MYKAFDSIRVGDSGISREKTVVMLKLICPSPPGFSIDGFGMFES